MTAGDATIPYERRNDMRTLLALITIGLVTTGCASASQHRADVQDDAHERVTVGTVQKEIHVGMSGAEVVAALGSPNIVSTDGDRNEVWVYDRFATDAAYSKSQGGLLGLIVGTSGNAGAGGVGLVSQSAGASSRSQRTLTVVIKFDGEQRVRDFAYHTARF
jgi:outer membrane protein assembly factor BamE (lipoprotein component of BamABCDE complex)